MDFAVLLLFIIAFFLPPPNSSTYATSANGWVEDVRKMMAEMNSLSGPTVDAFAAMKMVGAKSAAFAKLIGPVSALVATGVETILAPESEELKAIALLHKKMGERFAQMTDQLEDLRNEFFFGSSMREYSNAVSYNIDRVDWYYRLVTDPDGDRTLWRDEFVNACTDINVSPISTLTWMQRRLDEWCPMPTEQETTIYVAVHRVFQAAEERVQNADFGASSSAPLPYDKLAYEASKGRITLRLTGLSKESANKQIAFLQSALLQPPNRTYYDVDELVAELGHYEMELGGDEGEYFPCLLKEVTELHTYKRRPLQNVVEIIRRDLLHLQSLAGQCANLSFDGSSPKMENYTGQVVHLVEAIAGKVSQWGPAKMHLAWPDVILLHAKKTYPNVEGLEEYMYNLTARRAKRACDERGPSEFLHNVIISPPWVDLVHFWAPCASQTCTKSALFKQTNLIVTRYPKVAYLRAQRAHEWLERERDNILSVIAENWKTDNLLDLVNRLNVSTSGKIRDPSLYPNIVVFIRNSKLPSQACTIPFGAIGAFVHLPEFASMEHVEYFHNRWYFPTENAERFLLFFLL